VVYLGRFRVDVADNLLARKHVTQVRILERARRARSSAHRAGDCFVASLLAMTGERRASQ
jgi:hypothetical protein